MIQEGTIIQTPGMLLKVKEARGKWVRCDYWDEYRKEWRPRGCTESSGKIEVGISEGRYSIMMNQ